MREIISIPFWSDFNDKKKEVIVYETFQSHFGLILTPRQMNRKEWIGPFQSHFGLILTVNEDYSIIISYNFNPILV